MSNGNTKYGIGALKQNVSGNNNSAFGICSSRDTNNSWNTSFGAYANMSNTSGISNVALGTNSLLLNNTGSYNTALGTATLLNTLSNANTAIGSNAMEGNTIGSNNVAVGCQAGYNSLAGEKNIFIGSNAGIGNVDGSENIFLGFNAGKNSTSNYKNIFLGANTNNNFGHNNATVIGTDASMLISDGITLGLDTDKVLIPGTAYVNNINSSNELATKGYVNAYAVTGIVLTDPCECATLYDISLTGQNIPASIDGVNLIDGMRVLVRCQDVSDNNLSSSSVSNGIYIYDGINLVRSSETDAENQATFIRQGAINGNILFKQVNVPAEVGVDLLKYNELITVPISPGNGLEYAGNTINVKSDLTDQNGNPFLTDVEILGELTAKIGPDASNNYAYLSGICQSGNVGDSVGWTNFNSDEWLYASRVTSIFDASASGPLGNNTWYNLINVRHGGGNRADGNKYGCQIATPLNDHVQSRRMFFRGQYNISGNWTPWNEIAILNNGLDQAFANKIIQSGTTATSNSITQNIIQNDVELHPNVLKYTQIKYYSSSETDKPALQLINSSNDSRLNICPDAGQGSYGSITQSHDRLIIAVNASEEPSALTLTTYGPNEKHGIRIHHSSESDYATNIYEGPHNFKVDKLTGITCTGDVSMNNKLRVAGDASFNSMINQPSTTPTNNKLVQNIISLDTSGNPNVFKYTNIYYNSNTTSGSGSPALNISDTYNGNALLFLPNSAQGSWNAPFVSANNLSIVGKGSSYDNANLLITTWASLKNGIKISSSPSSAQTGIYAGDNSVILNNSSGLVVDLSSNQKMTMKCDVSMDNKLRVAGDASFNSNVTILGTVNIRGYVVESSFHTTPITINLPNYSYQYGCDPGSGIATYVLIPNDPHLYYKQGQQFIISNWDADGSSTIISCYGVHKIAYNGTIWQNTLMAIFLNSFGLLVCSYANKNDPTKVLWNLAIF